MKKLLLIYFTVCSSLVLAQTTLSTNVKKTVVQDSPGSDASRSSVEIYPNPASSEIHIRLDYSTLKSEIKLYSINGSSVLRHDLSGYETEVDISSLPDGFYFYEIIADGKVVKVGRLIKK